MFCGVVWMRWGGGCALCVVERGSVVPTQALRLWWCFQQLIHCAGGRGAGPLCCVHNARPGEAGRRPVPPPPLAWGYHSAASVRRARGARARAVAAERACCARRRGTAAGLGPPHTFKPAACLFGQNGGSGMSRAAGVSARARARVAAAPPSPPQAWPAAEGPRPLQIRLVCLLLLLQHCWRCAAAPMHAKQAVPSSQRSRQCCRTQG